MPTIVKRPLTKRVSIYVLKDPRTNEIRYVGKTKRSLKIRLSEHLQQKAKDHHSRWINSLLKQNLQPLIEEVEKCSNSNWEEREKFWIQYYKNLNFNLTNSNDGGPGSHNPSSEARAKISAANKGRIRSAETRAKMSAASKNKSAEARAKISAANKGRIRSAETRAKIGAASKNRTHTAETRAKISAAQKRRHNLLTEEHKDKQ
jgi:hypothetical protein